MRNPFSNNETEPTAIDKRIAELHASLQGWEDHTEEYAAILDQLVKLEKLKNDIKSPSWTPSPDAVLGAVASVGGIFLVLHYEKIGAVTSKAFSLVRKATN